MLTEYHTLTNHVSKYTVKHVTVTVTLYLLLKETRHSSVHEPCAADPNLLASEAASRLPHVNCTSKGYLPAATVAVVT